MPDYPATSLAKNKGKFFVLLAILTCGGNSTEPSHTLYRNEDA